MHDFHHIHVKVCGPKEEYFDCDAFGDEAAGVANANNQAALTTGPQVASVLLPDS